MIELITHPGNFEMADFDMKHTLKLTLLALIVICLTIVPVTAKADGAVPVPKSSDVFMLWGRTLTSFEIKHVYIPKDNINGWSKNLLVYYIVLPGGSVNTPIVYNPDNRTWTCGVADLSIDELATKSKDDINNDIDYLRPYFWVDEIPAPADDVTSSSHSAPHTHNWIYGIIYDATEDTDGLEGEHCSCGATRNTSIIPAGDIIISNNYAKIDAAKSGQNIVLDMKTMCNLSQTFMKKLAARNNCSFTIRLKYKNKLYEFYIPAGTVFDTSLPYYGPEKLMEMFEYKEL